MNHKVNLNVVANELISYYVPGGVFEADEEMFRSWGTENGISIPYDNSIAYRLALRLLFETNKDVVESYTIETFEKKVAAWLSPHVLERTTVDLAATKAFFKELTAVPVTDHDVFRPIFGIKLIPKPGATVLGPYTVYSSASHLKPVVRGLKPKLKEIFFGEPTPYLVRVTVRAREFSKAVVLADAHFAKFENIVRFMLGDRGFFYEMGILNYQGLTRRRAIVLSPEGVSSSSQKDGPTLELEINHPYFRERKKGFDIIWSKLKSDSNSELMNRLLLAAEWVGQSFAERVPSSAFIKATIALEILFTPNPGEFVSPSIVSQLSESVALLLGTDIEHRFKLESDVKRLYKIRSLIAHAGKSDVQGRDLNEIQTMARAVIVKMLITPSMRKISTGLEMNQLFKTLKYSCKPFKIPA